MNFILFSISTILATTCLFHAEANDHSSNQLRNGERYLSQHPNITICARSNKSPQVYKTMVVSRSTAMRYIETQRAVKGCCNKTSICKKLCTSNGNFTVTKTQCRCLIESTPKTTTNLTYAAATTTTAPVAPATSKPTNAPTTDATTTTAPVVPATPESTNAPNTAPVTGKPTSAPIVKTRSCPDNYNEQFAYNPCGPGGVCVAVTETGRPICGNIYGCHGGCDPNSKCIKQPFYDIESYSCVCDAGYSRAQPYLPCIAN